MSCYDYCGNRSVNIVQGTGITTIYSSDGTLLGNRTVNLNGNRLTFNGAQDLIFQDNGRLGATLYTSGLDDSSNTVNNFLFTNATGTFFSAPIHLAGMLPVVTESSGIFTAQVNKLTPVNVSVSGATVSPPGSPATNNVFEISDSRANSSANNILINFSGASQLFHGVAQNFVINSNASFSRFRYLGGSIGWIVEK